MNEAEALAVLRAQLESYRRMDHRELRRLVARPAETIEIRSSSGSVFQVEIFVVRDDPEGKTLRVIGAIDDGRLPWAIKPLTMSFLCHRQEPGPTEPESR